MDHHDADILGQPDSLVPPMPTQTSLLASTTRTAVAVLAVWFVYAFVKKLWARVLRWKENTHKLAMRRRHGIPDSDLRPFNVAYADAMAKAQQEDGTTTSKPSLRPRPRAPDHSDSQPDSNLRQRSALQQTPARYPTVPVPGAFSTAYSSTHGDHRLETSAEPRFATSRHIEANRISSADHAPSSSRAQSQSGYNHVQTGGYQEDHQRGLDDEDDQDYTSTRVQEDDLLDGDEDVEFQDELEAPIRGAKRGFGEDDNEDTATKRARGKRARKISLEKQRAVDENMDVDDEDEQMDEVMELMSPANRGKKRDREEAASTYGGDDDESEVEPEDTEELRRRRRKRRTVAKRQSEASYLRGQKRDREGNENLSDNEVGPETSPVQKKKRGKRPALVDQNKEGDISMDESITSRSSKTKRNIGDEWESHGIRWKIGPNGQRLRQALVKKARQKFTMPKDSQHPDRQANLQVCIECWMTEAEYQDAKAKNMLAWQDSPSKDERELSIDTDSIPFPSSVLGKSLLWSASAASSPTGSPASSITHDIPTRTRSFPRHSIASTNGIPFNPFVDASTQSVRRIASSSRATSLKSEPSASGPEALNGSPRPAKTFSKWEKQELEASAMMKIRNANKKKEEERDAKIRLEREKAEREKQERERLERERAARLAKEKEEAEKKAKEAAAPKITVTAPSSDGQGQPPASVPAPAGSAPVPNNFFGSKPSTTTTTPAPVPAPGGSVPNFFSTPSTQPTTTATTTAPTTSDPSKPVFSFGSTPTAPMTSTAAPSSSFAPSGQPVKKDESKPPGGLFGSVPFGAPISTTQPSSLLARLGPAASEPAKQGDGSKTTPDSKPSNFFQPAGTGPSASATTNGTLKFSFAPPASSTTSTDASKSASPFSFKTPEVPASATTNTSTTATTTPASAPSGGVKFNFGPPASSSTAAGASAAGAAKPPVSVFGNSGATSFFGSNTGSSTPTTAASNNASKPAPTTTTTPTSNGANPFGSLTTIGTGAGSMFGGTNSGSVFGGAGGAGAGKTGSVFGASSTPTTTPGSKPTSVFGSTTTPGSSVFGGGNTGAKPTGAFGTTGASTIPASSPWPAPGASTTPASNPFGAKTTSSFSFTPSSTSTPSTNPSSTANGATNGSSAPIFSFNAPKPGPGATTTTGPATSGPSSSSTFTFGTPSTTTSSGTTTTPAKSTFSFTPLTPAGGAASTTPASTPFQFGGGSTTPAASPFGAPPSGGSLFGGATSAQNNGTSSLFGATQTKK